MRIGKRVVYRLNDVEDWLDAQEAETARGGVSASAIRDSSSFAATSRGGLA